MNARRLEGEIAIVTGADSGIGRATAIAFGKEGATVAVTYFQDREGAVSTTQAIVAEGGKAQVFQLDQRDSADVARLFREVNGSLGLPTALINNAGVNARGTLTRDMSDQEWDDTLRTNLYGPFYCCREFIRGLAGTGKHGNIINITSVHQEIPRAGAAAYDASKGGLRNLTTTLALELGDQNINVNNIAPGMILTPMNQQALDDPELLKKREASIPLKRAGQPEDIAHAALFLASPQARYVHGATLVVDGALMLFQGQGA